MLKKVVCTLWAPNQEKFVKEIMPKYPDLEVVFPAQDFMMTKDEVLSHLKEADALIHATNKFPVNKEILALAPKLKIVANHGAGYDGIDLETANSRGIWVTNTPDVVNHATAEIAILLLLATSRRAYEAEKLLREGSWKEKKLNDFMMGNSLSGKILGIVGMGGIGKEVAKRARAFGMHIAYHNRNRLSDEEEKEFNADYKPNLDDLLTCSDYVTLHCPLNQTTKNLIGKSQFEKMKKGAHLINTSRGGVVDQRALVDALKNNTIKGAGLDVFESEPFGDAWPDLREMKNVTLLPHIGTCADEARVNMLTLCFDNVANVLAGKSAISPVNTPVVQNK